MDGDAGWYYHSGGSNDWDLNAVVRYACRGRVPPPPLSEDPFSPFFQPPAPQLATGEGLPRLVPLPADLPFNRDPAVVDQLSTAFFGPSAPSAPHLPHQQQEQAMAATYEESFQLQQDNVQAPPPPHLPHQQQEQAMATNKVSLQLQQDNVQAPPPVPLPQTSGWQASGGVGSSRSKKKKKPVKKEVKRVAADGLSADPWAWRKYGQKPIKGSPYPRGYYRCSTDKACEARKMVERCRDDPDTFILTYTGGDHNHEEPIYRNSLAGTIRSRTLRESPAGGQGAPGGATATAEPSPGQSTSGGTSTSRTTTSQRSPSMDECNQDVEAECNEAGGASMTPKEVETDAEHHDELKKLLDTVIDAGGDPSRYETMEDAGGAGVSSLSLLNVVEETFVVTPWVTALGDATAGWS